MSEEVEWKVLDSRVLVVAVANVEVGDWTAYIGAVEGKKHSVEYLEVKGNGSKLHRKVAALLFPGFDRKYRWRE